MHRCTATKPDGTPCRAWAVKDSQPPRCAAHGGGSAAVGAPIGNANAQTHGLYARPTKPLTTIEDVIADLAEKQARLSAYIDECLIEPDIDSIKALLAIHAQTASRLGKLLRDQRALSGEAADGISGAIAAALAELGTELGADLVGPDLLGDLN